LLATWVPIALVTLTLAHPVSADAAVLWYNGDSDGSSGALNRTAGSSSEPVFDDFIVPGNVSIWNITAVFSDNAVPVGTNTSGFTSANWSLRAGMSAGNGGTILFSGTGSPASWLATGRTLGASYTEYQVTVSALSNISLPPGTYWLNVQPNLTGSTPAYDSTTSGTNAIGTPAGNNGQAFYYDPGFANYSNTTTYLGSNLHDFSMGVSGQAAVPEPAVWMLLSAVGALHLGKRPRRNTDPLKAGSH
jgi:hypothetical protein